MKSLVNPSEVRVLRGSFKGFTVVLGIGSRKKACVKRTPYENSGSTSLRRCHSRLNFSRSQFSSCHHNTSQRFGWLGVVLRIDYGQNSENMQLVVNTKDSGLQRNCSVSNPGRQSHPVGPFQRKHDNATENLRYYSDHSRQDRHS